MDDISRCGLCGEPMPEGETMFKYHGFSGPCPAPPLPRPRQPEELLAARIAALEVAEAALQAGRDVMAVIHGDGGHYCEAHGDRKAADDAINIVYKLRADLAIERERREAAEAELAAERSAAVAERGIAAPPYRSKR